MVSALQLQPPPLTANNPTSFQQLFSGYDVGCRIQIQSRKLSYDPQRLQLFNGRKITLQLVAAQPLYPLASQYRVPASFLMDKVAPELVVFRMFRICAANHNNATAPYSSVTAPRAVHIIIPSSVRS
ncbi:hypothetical protein L798_06474 [Zootermopsis nevadensis]|uniref:Uncharacterized protein n=1 Tax=Zootermopsis nevadensis TaxID=136037 RepID=A0A067RF92_ZOONE|nr:hypothetical protein L798_06474 [Zootermopsis nevadensis]